MDLRICPIDFLWDEKTRTWSSVCDEDPRMNLKGSNLGCLISRLKEDYPDLHWLSATDDGKVVLHGMAARLEEIASSEVFSGAQE